MAAGTSMGFGMVGSGASDIMGAVNRKYNIQEQSALADLGKARAQVGLMDYQADPNSLHNRKIGTFGSPTGTSALGDAQAAATKMQTALAPGMAMADQAAKYAQAQAPGMQYDLGLMGADAARRQANNGMLNNFSEGTANVQPGAGGPPNPKDTVPANLAPGEAVLSREAADILGRQAIEFLNALGSMKANVGGGGMVPAEQEGDSPAKGKSTKAPQAKVAKAASAS